VIGVLPTVWRIFAIVFPIWLVAAIALLAYAHYDVTGRAQLLHDTIKVDEPLLQILTDAAFLDVALPTFGSSISAKKPGLAGASDHCLWILRDSKGSFYVQGKDTEGSVLPLTDLSDYLGDHISDLEACDQMDFTVQAHGWVWRGTVTVEYDKSLAVRSVQQPVYWN
jgi:hypothetical protein